MQFINGHTHTYGVQEPVLVVKLEHNIDRNELDIIGSINSGSTEWIIGTLHSTGTISLNKAGCKKLGLKIGKID